MAHDVLAHVRRVKVLAHPQGHLLARGLHFQRNQALAQARVPLDQGQRLAHVVTRHGGHAHRPSVSATIYSDDRGITWHAGAIVARHTESFPNPSETAVAEAAPGRVLLSIRTESPRNRRVLAWSADGATAWSQPAFADVHEQLLPLQVGARSSLVHIRIHVPVRDEEIEQPVVVDIDQPDAPPEIGAEGGERAGLAAPVTE